VADVQDLLAPRPLELTGPAQPIDDGARILVGRLIPADLAHRLPSFEERAETRAERLWGRVIKRSDLPVVIIEPQPVGL